ncbi:MAG: acylneuraminate cytidylyltransferase family protein [Gammaproteobacteria bacterium]|jgi:N-acylneuraminate cytidylyltransferase
MKGHSSRVPRKNLKMLNGAPLYHWVVHALQRANKITEIIIETDSDEIAADVIENFDLRVIRRPQELIGDEVPMNDLIEYHISVIESDIYLQTHSTNPLLKPTTIDNAIQCFIDNRDKYDSLFSVTCLQTRLYFADGKPVNHNPEELIPTQDLPVIYEENSNLYLFTAKSFAANKKRRIGQNPAMFEINKLEAVDIDNIEDFMLAEALIMQQTRK